MKWNYLIVFVTAALLLSACAQPTTEFSSNEELVALRSQVAALTNQLSENEKTTQEIMGQVTELVSHTTTLERKLAENEKTIGGLRAEIMGKSGQIESLEAKMARLEKAQMTPTPAPSPRSPSGTVFTYSGKSKTYTTPFEVIFSPVKIQWEVIQEREEDLFEIFVIDSTTKVISFRENWWLKRGSTDGQVLSYLPKGTYYLWVEARDVTTRWTIWVIENP